MKQKHYCRLCGLDDGACICAHIRPPDSAAMRAAEKHYIDAWRSLLWDATGDQTKVDRIIELAEINGLFDPARASLMACGKLAEFLHPATGETPASYRRIYDKMQRGKVTAEERTRRI